MTDKYHKLCNTCPFGTIKLDSLQRNLNQLQEQIKYIKQCALPDPYDERDISLKWLCNKIKAMGSMD